MQRSCLENDWLRVQALSHRFTPSLWAVVFRSQSTSGDLLFIYNSESVACWDTEEPSSWTGSLPLPAPGFDSNKPFPKNLAGLQQFGK